MAQLRALGSLLILVEGLEFGHLRWIVATKAFCMTQFRPGIGWEIPNNPDRSTMLKP